MSDYNKNATQNRGRRRRGGRNRNPNFSSNSIGESSYRPQQQSGFQKFLSIITFGLLGKSKRGSSGRSEFTAQPQRTPREPGPIARADREARDSARRENRASRQQPHSMEVTGDRLYVGNLSYDAVESDLFELFNGSGRVKNAEVVINNRTQRSKGFAFVTMMSIDEAKKAVADLHNKDFMGRPLVVGGAKPLPEGGRREEPENRVPDEDAITPPAEDSEEEQHAAA